MIPTIDTYMWTDRTDTLIANLRNDEILGEALGGEPVYIAGGTPQFHAHEFAVFVERRPNAQKDEYGMSGNILTVKATWNVVCVVRRVTLSSFYSSASMLSANIHRNLLANRGPMANHVGETIWSVAIVGVPEVGELISDDDEYLVEAIPVQLVFQVRT